MVLVIDEKHVVVTVERYAARSVEVAVAAALPSPGGDQVALTVVHRDPLKEIVSQVQIVVTVQRESGWADHLAGLPAMSTDLAIVVVVPRYHLDPDYYGLTRAAATGDEYAPVAPDNHRGGKMEAAALRYPR